MTAPLAPTTQAIDPVTGLPLDPTKPPRPPVGDPTVTTTGVVPPPDYGPLPTTDTATAAPAGTTITTTTDFLPPRTDEPPPPPIDDTTGIPVGDVAPLPPPPAPAADGVTQQEPVLPPATDTTQVPLPPPTTTEFLPTSTTSTGTTAVPPPTPTTTEFINGPGDTGPIGNSNTTYDPTQREAAAPPPAGDFGPGNNLIGTQIGPTTDPRLQQTQQDVDAMRQAVLGQYGGIDAPDRQALALESMRLLDEATADERTRGVQQIGREAARLGRLGSGMVTTDLGNLEERLGVSRDRAMRALASETAGRQLEDDLRALGAGQNVLSQFGNLEGQQYQQGAGARDELRGERGYQYALDRQALADRLGQTQLEQTLSNEDLQRQAQLLGLLGGYGYDSQSPVYQSLMNYYGGNAQAGGDAIANLLAMYGMTRGG